MVNRVDPAANPKGGYRGNLVAAAAQTGGARSKWAKALW
jgi:hypothetical protein